MKETRLIYCAAAVLSLGACSGSAPGGVDLAAAEARYADYAGGRVHYKVLGSGEPTLVFVHGWASDMRVFREQPAALASDHRCIFVDLIGHGGSDKPGGEYSMNYLAGSIRAVLDEESVEQAVLLGHSNGAPVVRQFLRNYPERTRALVVIDGALIQVITHEQIQPMIDLLESGEFQDQLSQAVVNMTSPAIRQEITDMMFANPKEILVATLESANAPEIWKPDPITVPVLAISSPDPIWTPEYEAAVRSLAPGIDYRRIDGVGHFLMMEKPDEFHAMVQEFLREL